MSFRKYGGIQYAAKKNNISSLNNLSVTQNEGNFDITSNLNVLKNCDISGNLSANYIFLSSSNNYTQSANGLVPKSYVDTIAGGFQPKPSAQCATNTTIDGFYNLNSFINLPSNLVIDGYTVLNGDYVLVKNQGIENDFSENYASIQNGLYIYDLTNNELIRSSTLNYGSKVGNALIEVLYGNTNGLTQWFQTIGTNLNQQTVGTDKLSFSQYQSFPINYGEGLNLTKKNGKSTFNVNPILNNLTQVSIGTSNSQYTFDVSGNSYLNGDVIVNSNSYLNGDVIISKKLNVNSNSYFNGDVIINDKLSIKNTFDVNGNSNLNGDVIINKLYVNENSNLNGDVIIKKLFVNNNSYLNGDVIISKKLDVNNNSNLNGDVIISDKLNVNGNSYFNEDVIMRKKLSIKNTFDVNGNSYFNEDVIMSKKLSIKKSFDVNGLSYLNGDVIIKSDKFDVNGNSYFNGDVFISDKLSIKNTFDVNGISYFNGDVIMGNKLSIKSFDVNGNSYFNGDVIMGKLSIKNIFDVNGNSYFNGDVIMNNKVSIKKLNTTGNSYFNGNVIISDKLSLNLLNVISNSNLNGDVTIGNILNVNDNSFLNRNVSIGNILNVSGNSYLKRVDVSGNSYFDGDVVISKKVDIKILNVSSNSYLNEVYINKLDVSGNSYLNGNVMISDRLDVTGNSYFNEVSIKNAFDVSGDSYFNGDVKIGKKENTSSITLDVNGIINAKSFYLNGKPLLTNIEPTYELENTWSNKEPISFAGNNKIQTGIGTVYSVNNGDVAITNNLYLEGTQVLSDNSVQITATPSLLFPDFLNNTNLTNLTWVKAKIQPDVSLNWQCVSVSSSGQYQTAVVNCNICGNIYISSDYGQSWKISSNLFGPQEWYYVAVSSSGQYQTAVVNSDILGNIYISSNYGESWKISPNSPGPLFWRCVAISSSGQYQTANTHSGYIYISSDYGEKWLQVENTNNYWVSVSISSSGQYQTACTFYEYIYISSNYGKSWLQINNTFNPWNSVSISSSGQYQSAVSYGGFIYISNNYGKTWIKSPNQPTTSLNWSDISVSSSGQYQTATMYDNKSGNIYMSSDYGNTWMPRAQTEEWYGISLSSSGQYQTAVVDGGYIYILTIPYPSTTINGNLDIYGNIYGSQMYISGPLSDNPTSVVPKSYVDLKTQPSTNLQVTSSHTSNNTLSPGGYIFWNSEDNKGETDFINCNSLKQSSEKAVGGWNFYNFASENSSQLSSPVFQICYDGSIILNGTVTTGADYRIKEDIRDFSLNEFSIDNLRPVYFKFKESQKKSIGLIAHEIQKDLSFLVEGEKDGNKTQSVNYISIISLLIKEVQELKKEVKLLKLKKKND